MKISLNWLNDYVDLKDKDKHILANAITKAGVNVESVITYNNEYLVVGHVLECIDHPNSDHLHVCKIDVGEVLQIVCGAPNIKIGQKVIVALCGCNLPNGITIKKSVIRGTESNGMVCALEELGLEEKSDGIYVLDNNAVIGSNPYNYLGLSDTIYELDLNPNRVDCLSHLGFSYLAASVIGSSVNLPKTDYKVLDYSIKDKLELVVDESICSLYTAKYVKDVSISLCPEFMKERLDSCGIRSINNVVDISNYIMFEYGQPLHFFDADKLGNKIIVRRANEGEKCVTLDGVERVLSNEDIVIANEKEVVAIAGVMGCLNTEVTEETKNIVVESAIFDSLMVRKTSIKFDLRSEASLRNEKPLNYEYTYSASDRACYLLETYAGSRAYKDTLVFSEINDTKKVVSVTLENINSVLGVMLDNDIVGGIFERLKFYYSRIGNTYTVTIPNRRCDVSIKEDLIEEIGSLYGYDNIVARMPLQPIKKGVYNKRSLFFKNISMRLKSLGLTSVLTYTLTDLQSASMFNGSEGVIKLLKPLSSDKAFVRKSIIPSLLRVFLYNKSFGISDVSIFEISNIYYEENSEYVEQAHVSMLMHGNILNSSFKENVKYDFYAVKGVVESLLNYLGFKNRINYTKDNIPSEMHPFMSASIVVDNEIVGYFGKIHPMINKNDLYVVDINLDKLLNKKKKAIKYNEPSKYPSIIKDMAYFLEIDKCAEDIIKTIRSVGGKTLVDVKVFDVYQNDSKKSIGFSLTFNDSTRTLTEEEVMITFNKIIDEVIKKHNALLRDK